MAGGIRLQRLLGAWGLVITNCVARGAQRGFNNDTFPNYRISLAGRFDMPAGVCYGIYLVLPNRWSRFYKNTITLKGTGSSGFVIENAGGPGNNIILDHNTVIATGGNAIVSYNLNVGYRQDLIPINVHLEKNSVVNNGAGTTVLTLVPASVGYMSGNSVNGTLSSWPVPQPNLGWTYSPSQADLLNDGTVDLLLQDPAEYVYSYSLSGAAVQAPTTTRPSRALQAGWSVVGAGDINVDGQTDLFLNHPDYGLGYWLMSGNVCTEAGPITYHGQPCVLGGTWQVVGVADFNGDGKPDLLLQDESSYLGIWHLAGTEIADMALLSRNYSAGFPAQPSRTMSGASNGRWRAVGTGDFNGDGKPDILFQFDLESNPQTDGQLAVWYMDDVKVVGTAMLDPVRQI